MKFFTRKCRTLLLLTAAVVLAGGVSAGWAQQTMECGGSTDWETGEVIGTITATLSASGKVLTIRGNGNMCNASGYSSGYSNNSTIYQPWHTSKSSITNVIIEEGVTSIGQHAFSGFTALTSVTIPNSVTKIDGFAFDSCTNLTSIAIPNSVEYISWGAFYKCTNLASVTIPNSVKIIDGGTEGTIFWVNGKTYRGKVGVFSGCTKLKEVTIGSGVTYIGSYAFYGSGLTSITIPNSVDTIGKEAFAECGLTSVTIGNGVTEIGEGVFSGCTGLKTVAIPNSVTKIGPGAFHNTGLISVTIPNSVTTIGILEDFGDWRGAFSGCDSLTSITIPNSVITIGKSTFSGCNRLTSITIPNNVYTLGKDAFSACSDLTSITIGNGVTSLNGFNFKKGGYYGDGYPKLTTLVIGDGVTTFIEDSMFVNYTALTSVTIGNGVTEIGERAFSGCTGLKTVTIGSSVDYIFSSAFANCSKLSTIISLKATPPVSTAGVFSGVNKSAACLYVPEGSIAAYKSAQEWKDFTCVNSVPAEDETIVLFDGAGASGSLTAKVGGSSIATGALVQRGASVVFTAAPAAGYKVGGWVVNGADVGDTSKTYTLETALSIATVTVTFVKTISVASHDRVIPSVKSTEAATIVPAAALTAEFTVGPNPAVRSFGAVNFFRSGAVIKNATLRVYDASGKSVKKIFLSDKSVAGNSVKRSVGSWDLKDAKDRPVPEGTYLLRGVLQTSGGKSEKVSVVVGVR